MAKSMTVGKRENEKKRIAKREEKLKKKENKKLSGSSNSFEDMIAYVDGFTGIRKGCHAFGFHPFFHQPVADATAEHNIIFNNQDCFHRLSSRIFQRILSVFPLPG